MKQRLVALDVLRGLTVGGMILVNTPGSWRHVYAPLRHAAWNGMTPTDLVFPFFLFMMGVSACYSLRKFDYRLDRALLAKILRRTLLIFLIGIGLNAFGSILASLRTALQEPDADLGAQLLDAMAHVRISGVLQRLAICYGIGSLILCTVRHRLLPALIAGLLAGYYLLLQLGDGFVQGPESLLARVDAFCLGAHSYKAAGPDPEGVLSTIPSVAHLLIGFCIGRICTERTELSDRLVRLFLYGSLLLMGGLLFQYLCPLNKKIWSPTFALAACGLATLLLAILIRTIDQTGRFRHTWPLEVFGMNPLFCYIFSQLFSVAIVRMPLRSMPLYDRLYAALAGWLSEGPFASLLCALIVTGVVWLAGLFLYRRKICIRI
ncbi:MAG: heparan-alpha-glucosaminide N-acetyltransferase domain-containing protein [Alistipes sp.]|nr:heparan-alpha-glucosaminide N-acetyltransferase domain-containing protein [Alistipes sp.]